MMIATARVVRRVFFIAFPHSVTMIELPTEAEPVRVVEGDCFEVLPQLPADSFDSIVTDPPYGLSFMGKSWDHGIPGVPFWVEALRVLRPGGYMLAMGGTRTYHRLACAIEDAGFEIRDCLMWLYGSGFPKHKACLKPAYEPILLARKPGEKSTPLNIDECRISTAENLNGGAYGATGGRDKLAGDDRTGASLGMLAPGAVAGRDFEQPAGRWPANIIHDGSEEVLEAFAEFGEKASNSGKPFNRNTDKTRHAYGKFEGRREEEGYYGDSGSAARFFYCAKASRAERDTGLEEMPVVKCGLMQDDGYM